MPESSTLLELIEAGELGQGQQLSCSLPGVAAEVCPEGLNVNGQVFADPTDAASYVLGREVPDGAGWSFWKVEDTRRGFVAPLEHVRVAWASRHDTAQQKTSLTHPLRVDALSVPGVPGRLGLTFCPGKTGPALYGGAWNRDLRTDLDAIREWGAGAVLTLMEPHEFGLLGVADLPQEMRRQPFAWHWLEIRDSDVPDERFERGWPEIRASIHEVLQSGAGVVIHCRGGLGRTGMIAALLLVEAGVPADQAIAAVRQARKGAIETWEQESYVRSRRPDRM